MPRSPVMDVTPPDEVEAMVMVLPDRVMSIFEPSESVTLPPELDKSILYDVGPAPDADSVCSSFVVERSPVFVTVILPPLADVTSEIPMPVPPMISTPFAPVVLDVTSALFEPPAPTPSKPSLIADVSTALIVSPEIVMPGPATAENAPLQ